MRLERPDALDALDVSDATSLTRTQLTMAPCVQTQHATAPCVRMQLTRRLHSDAIATAYSIQTRSVRAFAFRTQLSGHHAYRPSCQGDGVRTQLPRHIPWRRGVPGHLPSGCSCHGITRTDAAVKATAFRRNCHGIFLLDDESQGIRHPNATRVLQTQSVKANVFRTRSVRAFTIQTQRVCSGRRVSWHISSRRRVSRQMSSGRRVPRHLPSGRGLSGHLPLRTQGVKAIFFQWERVKANFVLTGLTMERHT